MYHVMMRLGRYLRQSRALRQVDEELADEVLHVHLWVHMWGNFGLVQAAMQGQGVIVLEEERAARE